MKKKMLLVDDKVEFRKLVKIILAKKFEVTTAENGLEALALLQGGFIPDAIISDLMMPEVDGITLVKQLKSSGVFSQIPIMILSSIDKSDKRIELLKTGADDFMIKPFNPEELEVRIDKLLEHVS